MKKKIGLSIGIILICFTLIVFIFYKKTIPINQIPKKTNIVSMMIIKDDIKKEVDSGDQEKILKLMSESYSGLIKKQSPDDFPKVEKYFTIYFVISGETDKSYFVYNKNNKQYFLEKPYNGIYYTTKELYFTLENIVYQ